MWTERVWLTCPPADRCLGYSHGLVVTNNVNCERLDAVLGLSVCTGLALPGTRAGGCQTGFQRPRTVLQSRRQCTGFPYSHVPEDASWAPTCWSRRVRACEAGLWSVCSGCERDSSSQNCSRFPWVSRGEATPCLC